MVLSKNKIQKIRKLHQKKFREETQLFLVEGTKSVRDLLTSDIKVQEILATEAWLSQYGTWCDGTNIAIVKRADLERISTLTTPQEVMAIAVIPHYALLDINPLQPLLVLDDIRDPGNLGTILRTADWFGVLQVLCSANTVEFTNPKVVQATMGSFARVKIVYADIAHYLNSVEKNRRILGTFMSGDDIRNFHFNAHDIIIIGNETNGISPEISNLVTGKIHIPATCGDHNHAESLNASVAAAIVLFCRQNNSIAN
jgi:TrmH family RNA methyltransferase